MNKIVKNISFLMIGIIAIILNISKVNAKTYKTFNEGEKITINVSSNNKLKFYVMKDNGDSIKAILENTITDKYNYSQATEKTKSLKSEWSNATSVEIPDLKELLGLSEDPVEAGKLNKAKYFCASGMYWTTFEAKDNDGNLGHYTIWCPLTDNLPSYGISYDADELWLRPVITTNKDFVEGAIINENDNSGTNDDTIDVAFKNFVNTFKTTETYKWLSESNTIKVESTSNSLKITTTNENGNWITNFTYENGILNYIPSAKEDNLFMDSIWISNCLETIRTIKGYDYDQLLAYLDSKINLTIKNDGIEYINEEMTITEDNEVVSGSITFDKFDSFKLDIVNGIKNFKAKTTTDTTYTGTTSNPDTGINISILSILIIPIIIMGIITFSKIKNKSKNYM